MFKEKMFGALRAFKADGQAVTAIEYALIAALIAVVIVTAVTTLGTHINTVFTSVASDI